MNQKNSITCNWKSRLLSTFLFLFCAIPGLFIFLFAAIQLIAFFIDTSERLLNPLTATIVMSICSILMLVGVGEWRRWRYLLVFFSIPVSLFSVFFIGIKVIPLKVSPEAVGFVPLGFAMFIAFCAFTTHRFVRAYYQKRERNRNLKGSDTESN